MKHTMEDVQKHFDEYMTIENQMLDTKRILCDRIDAWVDIYNYYKEFHGYTATKDYIDGIMKMVQALIDDMQGKLNNLSFEDVTAEEYKDVYEEMFPRHDKCEDFNDIFRASVTFNFIRPFGERILNMRRLLLEEIEIINSEASEENESVEATD